MSRCAPQEPLYGFEAAAATDVYAFAITLCAMASGAHALWPNMPNVTLMSKVANEGLRPTLPPLLAPGGAAEEVGQLVQRCWSTEPAQRPSFEQLRPLLRDARAKCTAREDGQDQDAK